MTTRQTGPPFVLDPAIPEPVAHDVLYGAVAAVSDAAPVEVSGSGAVECLQGLLTNDLVAPGDGAFLYGALLTTKGMIVSDMWIARTETCVSLSLPEGGKAAVLETFKRTLPPRLASFVDKGTETCVIRLVGPTALTVAAQAGFDGDAEQTWPHDESLVGRPSDGSAFALQIACPANRVDDTLAKLAAAGARIGDHSALELARIWNGSPRLGAEIDEKTLPQEVRFDDLRGVSHAKGCYLGQETVARIHFRGHVNKRLMGLRLDAEPTPTVTNIVHDGTRVGRVTSIARVTPLDAYIALGVIRREIEAGARVTAGDVGSRTVELPFRLNTVRD